MFNNGVKNNKMYETSGTFDYSGLGRNSPGVTMYCGTKAYELNS